MNDKPLAIASVDPGGTTGISYWIEKDDNDQEHWGFYEIGPCDKDEKLHEVIETLRHIKHKVPYYVTGNRLIILCERFEFRMDERYRDKINYVAAEVIGAIRYWRLMNYDVALKMTSASFGKGFWTDDKIKALGLWVPGSRHAMDATRHLLRYRAFELMHKQLFERLKPNATTDSI